jgi:hypothetical protein
MPLSLSGELKPVRRYSGIPARVGPGIGWRSGFDPDPAKHLYALSIK